MVPLVLKSLFNYVIRRETPVRALAHEAVEELAPKLSGRVIELGGFGRGRRQFAVNATEYLVTNLSDSADLKLDATAMDLPDSSVDGVVCESVIEHVDEPNKLVREAHRVLRPGGRLLLLAPWMYPFHSAPADYLRFSDQALLRMLEGFSVLEMRALGNFWTAMATFAQLKVSPWREFSKVERAGRIVAGAPLLTAGLAFYGLSQLLRESDDFAPLYCVLAQKG